MEIQELKLSIPAQGISEGENAWILPPGTSGKNGNTLIKQNC